MPTCVLVTGALGNAGRNCVDALVRRNRADPTTKTTIRLFDKHGEEPTRALAQLTARWGPDAFEMVWGDLTKEDSVRGAMEGVTAVIHLAAVIPPLAHTNPALARRVNVDGTRNLLAAAAAQPSKPRFVLASSYSVMGPHRGGSGPGLDVLTPDTKTDPRDNYAKHKVECEGMVRAYEGEWAILRIGAVTALFGRLGDSPLAEYKRLFFSVPFEQRRHSVAAADVGLAFCNAAFAPASDLSGRVFLIGGDASWKMFAGEFVNENLALQGLLSLPKACFRRPDDDAGREPWYYEAWMDTAESQRVLQFQATTFADWKRAIRAQRTAMDYVQLLLVRLLSPLLLAYFCWLSPHFAFNAFGRRSRDPERNKSFEELVPQRGES